MTAQDAVGEPFEIVDRLGGLNHLGTTQTILDKSKLSDYEAGEHLINLIKREYIVAR